MSTTNPSPQRPPRDEALVSVVLPVFNEAQVIATLVQRVTTTVQAAGVQHELIFVNDGSTDGSGELLDQFAQNDPHIRVLHFSRNFGHQAAVEAGMEYAAGDALILMDSDLQDAPEVLGEFINQWLDGWDVVYAVRTARKENVFKRLLFRGFYRLMAAIATVPIPCDAGIFGLLDRRVAREIIAMRERDRFLPGLRSWVGFRQKGIVVERLARYDRCPRVSLAGLVRLAKTAIFSFSWFPLTLFWAIGLTALAVFLGLGSFALYCKLFTDLAVPGWTSHVLIGSFFGALNAMGISILSEYVIRIYDQVRARPLFVVTRKVNFDSPPDSRQPPPGPAAETLPSQSEEAHTLELLREAMRLLQMQTGRDQRVAPAAPRPATWQRSAGVPDLPEAPGDTTADPADPAPWPAAR